MLRLFYWILTPLAATSFIVAEMPPFFAFGYGFKDRSPSETVDWLSKNGYDGIAANVWNDQLFTELESIWASETVHSEGFKVYGVYHPMKVTDPEQRQRAKRVIRAGARHGTPLWLAIREEEATTENVVAFIQELADLAAEVNSFIVLYPHDRQFILTAEQSLELIAAADRPNVYTSLHLHHEMRAGNHDRLAEIIAKAAPLSRLASISATNPPDQINRGSRDWSDVVQPLSKNPEEVAEFVQNLLKSGYSGPIGYQNFGIPGNPETHHIESLQLFFKMGSGCDI